jgi:hypothetical protein
MEIEYWEYGIQYGGCSNPPHRYGMTEQQARDWINTLQSLGGNLHAKAFLIIRRPVGSWEIWPTPEVEKD